MNLIPPLKIMARCKTAVGVAGSCKVLTTNLEVKCHENVYVLSKFEA